MRLDQLGKFHKRPLGTYGTWKDRGHCGWHVLNESRTCGAIVSRDGKASSVNAGAGRKGTLLAIKDGDIESSMWWVCDEHKPFALKHNAGSDVYEVDRYTEVTLLNKQHMFEVSFRYYTQDQALTGKVISASVEAAVDEHLHGGHVEYLKVIG